MPLVELPQDVLLAVAEVVLRRGEAYWFSTLCHACAKATRAVCAQLRCPMASHARSACER